VEAMLSSWLARSRRSISLSGIPAEPYRCLESYTAKDAAVYFGRDRDVAELVDLLDSPRVRILSVFGPCGVGKSSLLAAGLVPTLDPNRHQLCTLVSGKDPARRLRTWILELARSAGLQVPRADVPTRELVELLHRLALLSRRTFMLILDQVEEVFTQNPRRSPRIAEFLDLVSALVEADPLPVKLVLGYRSEFRADLFALEERLAPYHRTFAVQEIDAVSLAETMTGPAREETYAYSFDEAFAQQLAAELVRRASEHGETALPRAQIICTQLYRKVKEKGLRVIASDLYEGALGGTAGILEAYVNDRLASDRYAYVREMSRQMLKILTVRGDGGQRFSRAMPEEELLAFPDRDRARHTLELLITDHLVVRDVGAGGDRHVRLSSETMCPTIDLFLEEPDAAEQAGRRLVRAYRAYRDQGGQPADHLQGAPLDLVVSQLPSLRDVTAQELAFLDACRARQRRSRLRTAGLAFTTLMTFLFLFYQLNFRPGRVHITTTPDGVEVRQGRTYLGKTPLDWEARPGVYALALAKKGYRDGELLVRVQAGADSVFQSALVYPRGVLSLVSEPAGAICRVRPADGPVVREGATPLVAELPVGTYMLELSAKGYASQQLGPVRIQPNGAILNRLVQLAKDSGSLMVNCAQDGVHMQLWTAAGQPVWASMLPLSAPQELPSGRYRLQCVRAGSAAFNTTLDITSGKTTTCAVSCRPIDCVRAGPEATIGLVKHPRILLSRVDLDGDGQNDVVVGTGDVVEPGRASQDQLYLEAISGRTRLVAWQQSFSLSKDGKGLFQAGVAAPLRVEGRPDVVVSTDDNRVCARDGRTGEAIWEATLDGYVNSIEPMAVATQPALRDLLVETLDRERGAEVKLLGGRDGRTIWSRTLGKRSRIVEKGLTPFTHAHGAPHQDIVGFGAGTKEHYEMLVFCPKTAGPRWRHMVKLALDPDSLIAGYATLQVRDLDGDGTGDILMESNEGDGFVAISGATGAELWRRTVPRPHGLEACSTRVFELSPRTLHCLHPKSGQVLWSLAVPGLMDPVSAVNSPIVPASPATGDLNADGVEDVIFYTAGGQQLEAYSGKDGHRLWTWRPPVNLIPPGTKPMIDLHRELVDWNRDGVPDLVVGVVPDRPLVVLSGKNQDVLGLLPVSHDPRWYRPQLELVAGKSAPEFMVTHSTPLPAVEFYHPDLRQDRLIVSAAEELKDVQFPGDLDGDSVCDVLLVARDQVTAFSGKVGRQLWNRSVPGIELHHRRSEHACRPGDLDGDGTTDLVVDSAERRAQALRGSDGKLLWQTDYFQQKGVFSRNLLDLDGDGRLDGVIAEGEAGKHQARPKLRAVRGRDGSTLWTGTLPPEDGRHRGLALAACGPDRAVFVWVTNVRGAGNAQFHHRLHCRAGRDGRQRWTWGTNFFPKTAPIVIGAQPETAQVLWILGSGHVVALAYSSGRLLWTRSLGMMEELERRDGKVSDRIRSMLDHVADAAGPVLIPGPDPLIVVASSYRAGEIVSAEGGGTKRYRHRCVTVLAALSAASGAPRWTRHDGSEVIREISAVKTARGTDILVAGWKTIRRIRSTDGSLQEEQCVPKGKSKSLSGPFFLPASEPADLTGTLVGFLPAPTAIAFRPWSYLLPVDAPRSDEPPVDEVSGPE
jgi:hypothetical protein